MLQRGDLIRYAFATNRSISGGRSEQPVVNMYVTWPGDGFLPCSAGLKSHIPRT